MSATPSASKPALGRRLVWLMAFAAGATVANLYFNQPLLTEIGASFGASKQALGLVPTLPQVGYAIGILLLVPLGDSLERRRMIVLLTVAISLALVAVAASPSLPFLLAASLVLGFTTVVPQLLIPFAAHLAPDESRGRIVGTVMSGVLIGILLSRTVAGFLGAWLGWRAVFWIAAGLMLLMAAAMRLMLPAQKPESPMPYPALLRSLGALWREEPIVRRHALLGAASFASFAAFWAILALHLQALPGAYGSDVAGIFGVVGVVGALAAPLVGRYADRHGGLRVNGIAISLLVLAYVGLWAFGSSLVGIAAGVILLDLGAQSNHISNQTRVYSRRPEARSRLNTLYMVSCFAGSSAGAWLASVAWNGWGWAGVCAVGAGAAALGWPVLAAARRRASADPQGARLAS
ncbi:MFS transporter [Vulgatibacter incomptus]|uniref:Major facilitator superfamily (MFS_1) transporter n=1 Tax=Vulgatibacter incomptus TaxID=1391653 RepID=A0A0K1PCL5_9BACT|nr:MFS transporter [Vulgatibacter incomptus]AKU91255.1 Major facilitator superfamily (MFS_1) transporter [Vulgatibacter incomptus]